MVGEVEDAKVHARFVLIGSQYYNPILLLPSITAVSPGRTSPHLSDLQFAP